MLTDPDESYESSLSFESTIKLVEQESKTLGYDLKNELLIIDTEEGIFVRTKHEDWCIFFDALCEVDNEELKFRPLLDGDWEALIEKFPVPDRLYGNNLLELP